MMRNMRKGVPNLMKDGTKHSTGIEASILRNIEACKKLTDLTRTSLGPNGMNKMIINHLDKLFVTSDCATIIREMEINHPAAKMIVLAASMQETEIGDGSNYVVCLAGELLSQAAELIQLGLHPSEIVVGYVKAGELVQDYMNEIVVKTAEANDLFDRKYLASAIKSTIMAKQLNYAEFLSDLVAEACLTAMPKNRNNFLVDNVRVAKVLGGNILASEVVKGMVINKDTDGTIKKMEKVKVAVFTCGLDPVDTETKGNVLINNAAELMNYNDGEEKELQAQIKAIADSGVNMIITGGNIDDMARHFVEKYKMMILGVKSKFELRRLCEATKARPLVSLGPVAEDHQGYCSHVYVREVGGSMVTILEQDSDDDTGIATILLRASSQNLLNDIETAVDDGVNTIRAMGKFGGLVAGAGASDVELSRKLKAHGDTCTGLEQYAINKYAEALLVVPKVLAENSGLNAMNVVADLLAAHEKGNVNVGVNIDGGLTSERGEKHTTIDAVKGEIYDLHATKVSALRLATNAVVTILRVDTIIQAKPAGGPKVPKGGGDWDAD